MRKINKPEKFIIKDQKNESGFSLIEVIFALMILLVAVLGIFAALTYATIYNGGNSQRSQALSMFQREIELIRSAKFTPTRRDAILDGGVKPTRNETAPSAPGITGGFIYQVKITVDDDPFTDGVQIDNTKTLKEITVEVIPQSTTGSWIIASPIKVVFRRVRAN